MSPKSKVQSPKSKARRSGMEEKWEVIRHLETVIKAPHLPEDLRIALELVRTWLLEERSRRRPKASGARLCPPRTSRSSHPRQ